jgi:putative oxidoreductase
MTKTITAIPAPANASGIAIFRRAIGLADHIPLSLVQLTARLAVATVFWKSAQSKLASWPITQQLFAMEYQVPLLSPEIAAPLATATELCGAVLLALGLLSRLAALSLLGVVAVIQLFVFPGHWGEHLLWASLLLLILARGAGTVSLDHVATRFFSGKA